MTLSYTPAEAFSPGEYLRDELDERGWAVTRLAETVDRPVHTVAEILDAKRSITAGTRTIALRSARHRRGVVARPRDRTDAGA